jgi:hypothetical protein
MRSSGRASVAEVGLERGKMTGLGVFSSMARTTGSVKLPAWPERPSRTVARAFSTVSRRLG